jgi:hypothetical protein
MRLINCCPLFGTAKVGEKPRKVKEQLTHFLPDLEWNEFSNKVFTRKTKQNRPGADLYKNKSSVDSQ